MRQFRAFKYVFFKFGRQFVNDFAQTKGLSDSGVDIMEDFAFDVLNNGE